MKVRATPALAAVAVALLCVATGCSGRLSADDQQMLDGMAAEHSHDAPVPNATATAAPARAVSGREIVYGTVAGTPLKGYLAQPKDVRRPRAGVIMIHEWWGLNDGVREEARRLAGEGYTVLAVDLYDGRQATAPPEAMKLSRSLTENPGPAEDNLRAAYRYLTAKAGARRIGTIGWCLGGRWSFRTAQLFPDEVDATVIYYGQVKGTDEELAKLKMPILGLFGSKDRIVPLPMVQTFEAQMKRLGKDVDIHVYEGADHAFANPNGGAYDARAAEDAWALTTAFLRKHLSP